jgi:cytochrome c peroxidase
MSSPMKKTLLLCAALVTNSAMADKTDSLIRKANRYFSPLPAEMPGSEHDTDSRIALGKKLYFDARLSINNAQSCASCHPVGNGRAGVDNLPTSPGAEGQLGTRNSPTVLNAGWQIAQFWDGRAKDLAEQAGQPILNPVEMAMPDKATVVEKLAGLKEYQDAFAAAFPASEPPLTYGNMEEAIAAFERTLRTESRFDDFLRGDKSALNTQEQRGLGTFVRVNCVRCHDGALLGGKMYEKLGVYQPFHNTGDQGRFDVTGKEEDRMVFKVAQLRNVTLTGPWYHDGSGATLGDVVRQMGEMQLDTSLKDEDVEDILAFLGSLSGKELEQEK